jgi:hypothetical protein
MAGRDDVRLAGGCQCGCVRYELSGAPDHVSVCHCRMCQEGLRGTDHGIRAGQERRLALDAGSAGFVPLFQPGRASILRSVWHPT